MNREGIVRLTVEDHFSYDDRSPEEFDWSLVINPRVQEISRELAEVIFVRRAQAAVTARGTDPLVAGLQEALRTIARTAIWATMTESKARSAREARWRFPIDSAAHGLEKSGIGKEIA